MATLKQMVVRMNGGHFQALDRLSQGLPMFATGSLVTPGDYRGARAISGTLCCWGAISGGAITDKGRELLEAARAKFTPAPAQKTVRTPVGVVAPPDDYEWKF